MATQSPQHSDQEISPSAGTELSRTSIPVGTSLLVGLAVVLVGTAIGLILGGGRYSAPPADLTDAGPAVSWGLALSRAVATVSGMATFGWLLYAAFLGPQQRNGLLGASGTSDIRRASTAAAVWAIASAVAAVLSLSVILGSPLSQTLSPTIIRLYAWDIPIVRAFALSALVALAMWAFARRSVSLAAAAGWSALALGSLSFVPLAGHSAAYGDHALALTTGVTHVWAAAAWFGGLLALAVHAWKGDRGVVKATARYSRVATIAVLFLLGAGVANGYTRMDTVSDLWNSGYGRLLTAKFLVFAVALLVAWNVRRRLSESLAQSRRAVGQLVAMELGLLALAIGFAVALTQTPYPRVDNSPATVVEQLLGRSMPDAPTWTSVVFGWQFEPVFLVGGLVAAAYYLVGVKRLHERGDHWPLGRTIAFLIGIAAIMWTTNGGFAVYSPVSFSIHMMQHMLLSMIAPILLVLGTPITLALRAIPPAGGGRRGPREWIVWGINSPLGKFVTHPIWVLLVFTVGLYGLYYTPLFSWLMGSHLGHLAMQVHFLAAGYLFAYVVLGLDPAPRKLPPWVRLLMLLVAIALHSFFAVPIMMSDVVFAGEWYSQVQPPWITDPLAETRLAGGIAWGIAEVPALMLMVVLGVQWARSDEREANRTDRQADRDGGAALAAYNEHLQRLHDASQRRGE
jgi:cytochrome c oxidase assembly factor CtaG